MVLKFRYHVIPKITNGLKKPSIPVEFKMKSGGYIETICLVDSGSDVIVLPKSLGELFGVKIKSKSISNGLGGKVEVGRGTISFRIKKEYGYHNITAPVEIVDDDEIPPLLGRSGFFDKFLVTIDERDQWIILKEYTPRIK